MGVIYKVFSGRQKVSDCPYQPSAAWKSNSYYVVSESVCFIIITTSFIVGKTIKSINNIIEHIWSMYYMSQKCTVRSQATEIRLLNLSFHKVKFTPKNVANYFVILQKPMLTINVLRILELSFNFPFAIPDLEFASEFEILSSERIRIQTIQKEHFLGLHLWIPYFNFPMSLYIIDNFWLIRFLIIGPKYLTEFTEYLTE